MVTPGMWFPGTLAVLAMAALAHGAERAPFSIPRLDGITIDGDPADWGTRGFFIGVLAPESGVPRPGTDSHVSARLGWDERGLLVLVNVADDTFVEGEEAGSFYQHDSVQIFAGAGDDWEFQLAVSPGMTAEHPDLRAEISRWPRPIETTPLAYEAARTKTAGGYTLEVRLPWTNFAAPPTLGAEIGARIVVNDLDTADVSDRHRSRWSSNAETAPTGSGLRLAEAASPPTAIVIGAGRYEGFARVVVGVAAVAEMAGKAVELRDEGGRVVSTRVPGGAAITGNDAGRDVPPTLATGVLQADGARASFNAMLPMPPFGTNYDLSVFVDGKPAAKVDLPDANWVRARTVMNTPIVFSSYVFPGEHFPKCDFEQPALIEQILGRYTLSTTFYAADFSAVTKAATPGRYSAVVEITPEHGPVMKRYRTLFRLPTGARLGEVKARIELPDALGVAPEVAQEQAALLADYASGRIVDALQHNAESAALLAYLYESKPNASPATVYDDAAAADRQWWVTLRRKMYGMDTRFAAAVQRPFRMDGPPAPVLHEGTAAEAGMKPDAVEQINAFCEKWAGDTDEPFTVCIAHRGVVFFLKAYGTLDGRPMTVHDKRNMASVTKPMGGISMMMLVDQGLIDLDDPLAKYFPAWRGITVPTPPTIRQIMNHTTGITDESGYRDAMHDAEEIETIALPYLVVGKKSEYSTSGYALAGKLVENVSGEALPQFYKRHLIDPLGLTETDATCFGYGTMSTPLDIARIGQILINHGAYGPWRFFSEETFQKMLPVRLVGITGPAAYLTWGMGLSTYKIDGLSDLIVGHGAASSATFRLDLKNQLVVVTTRNTAGKNYSKYIDEFHRVVARQLAE